MPRHAVRFPRERWRQLRDRTADVDDQHDRCVLSVAAAGISARGRSRSRLLDGRRNRGAASGRRVARSRAAHLPQRSPREDEHVALVFAQLGDRRARAGLAALLDRRIAAPAVLSRFLSAGPRDLTLDDGRAPRRRRVDGRLCGDAWRARSLSRDRPARAAVPASCVGSCSAFETARPERRDAGSRRGPCGIQCAPASTS